MNSPLLRPLGPGSRLRFILVALVPLLGLAFQAFSALEPWTDNRLPVTNGLELWFDASRQNAARGTLSQAPLQPWRDSVDFLFDGSGHSRHLVQPDLDSRPRFRQEFNGAFLSFDGQNDFLQNAGLGLRWDSWTVVVVGRPQPQGGYRGLIAFNAAGRNDYTSGFNLDLGSAAFTNLTRLNLEGAGFPGEVNLQSSPPQAPHRWHIFHAHAGLGTNGVALFLDGQPQGTRGRTAGPPVPVDQLTLGARLYSNTPNRPHVQGFLEGDLAEALVFNRVLTAPERKDLHLYLDSKYGALLRGFGGPSHAEARVPLVTVSNPPPVQVHRPGFASRRLPLELPNINNLRYRPDGLLVAVAYDGQIILLRDTDQDGLEDAADKFWDQATIRAPIGAALTPPGYPHGQGVFVSAKDKVSLIIDTNRDNRADREIVVATWKETSEQQGVDALGLAVGQDGSVYFGLGTASFTEPYRIDRTTGLSRYSLTSERGTIQKVSPDFQRRETVCTGIRFSVGLAFNRQGDLFCTDQEGATWVPNGNPFDELLHIQSGRHYGFPARHPRHLPSVVDEPSVFDYAPQHQSTCGINFNEPVRPGDPIFGPSAWEGDALIAGYSRGKLWRTALVKTPSGYVARTELLATLQSLVADMCVSPAGDLVVATHSGQPDWGSGPSGKGSLWKIHYAHPTLPQPVLAWWASPSTLRVAFDQPLDPAQWRDLPNRARLESGRFVFPGDRFETIRPGYQIVYDQLAAPRYSLQILSSQLSPDQRALTLVTRPREGANNTALTLPSPAPPSTDSKPLEQTIDLAVTPHGFQTTWTSENGQESWQGWLPHPDPDVWSAFIRRSADHDVLQSLLRKPGRLTLRTQLDLWQMLLPAIQPGSTIDHQPPPEEVTVSIEAAQPFQVRSDPKRAEAAKAASGIYRAEIVFAAPGQAWHPFEIQLETGPALALHLDWHTSIDPRPRAWALRRFFLPWVKPEENLTPTPATREIPEIAGGHWLRGRRLFFSDRLTCSRCHAIRGEGQQVGPDLSNLIHRDYASVRKDIATPNAAINPDHLASHIETKDDEAHNAIVLRETTSALTIVDATGVVRDLDRKSIKNVRPAALSLMPEGLWELMPEAEQRDLMTFLLTQPLEPADVAENIQGQARPAARTYADLDALLKASTSISSSNASTPLRIILCASPKDPGHGAPGFHDYPLWRERWSKLLALGDHVTVQTADRWPTREQWDQADVVAFYHDNPAWAADKVPDLDRHLDRGRGLVFLHWSMNAYRELAPLTARLGRAWGPGAKFRYGAELLKFHSHPLTQGFIDLHAVDESYWNLPGDLLESEILATTQEEGRPQPQIWTRTRGPGRIFVCIPGHFTWTFDDPLYRWIVLRGLCWAAGQPPDRLTDLATIGARIAPPPPKRSEPAL